MRPSPTTTSPELLCRLFSFPIPFSISVLSPAHTPPLSCFASPICLPLSPPVCHPHLILLSRLRSPLVSSWSLSGPASPCCCCCFFSPSVSASDPVHQTTTASNRPRAQGEVINTVRVQSDFQRGGGSGRAHASANDMCVGACRWVVALMIWCLSPAPFAASRLHCRLVRTLDFTTSRTQKTCTR